MPTSILYDSTRSTLATRLPAVRDSQLDTLALEQGREQIFFSVRGPNVVVAHDAFFIDDDVRALRDAPLGIPYSVGRQNFPVAVAQQGIVDLGKIGEGLL